MTGTDEKRRAAATCNRCGEIGIVRIWPDGTVKPVGQSDLCDCDSPVLRVLESEGEGEGEGEGESEGEKEEVDLDLEDR